MRHKTKDADRRVGRLDDARSRRAECMAARSVIRSSRNTTANPFGRTASVCPRSRGSQESYRILMPGSCKTDRTSRLITSESLSPGISSIPSRQREGTSPVDDEFQDKRYRDRDIARNVAEAANI